MIKKTILSTRVRRAKSGASPKMLLAFARARAVSYGRIPSPARLRWEMTRIARQDRLAALARTI